MKQAELAQLHEEARAEMKKIPGVVAVGYGFKKTGGKLTNTLGFTVWVKEKKDKSSVDPAEVIPAEFKGIPTDVEVVGMGRRFDCQDHTIHSPLAGGITISNLKPDPTGKFGIGTLGFFATVDGTSGFHNIVFVSNHHVLAANASSAGDTVFQPELVFQGGGWLVSANHNPIGVIANLGMYGNYGFNYPGDPPVNPPPNYFIDCASSTIDFCVSTLCHTHCGQSFTDQIINLDVNGSNVITDVARISQSDLSPTTDYVVYKAGSATGFAVGKVIGIGVPINVPAEAGLPGASGDNGILITPTQNNCAGSGTFQFADHGDSGAALINAQGKLVGIVFGGPPAPLSDAWAAHIHPVLDFLKVTPVTQANQPTGNPAYSTSTASVANPAAVQPGIQPSAVPALRQRLAETAEGSQLVKLIEAHAGEVVHLVNHNRRVTVTWHRNKGPKFMNEAVLNVHHPEHLIPEEIEGVTRETLLSRMAKVLADYGSAGLRNAVERGLENILPRLYRTGSLYELIDSLAARPAV